MSRTWKIVPPTMNAVAQIATRTISDCTMRVQGIGFCFRVTPETREQFLAKLRAEGQTEPKTR